MNFFEIFSFLSIMFTILVIFQNNPIYSLLFLILSFLSISGIYFSIGAFLIGSLETIIYAGAIMVLFIFVIMMLNLGKKFLIKERKLKSKTSFFISFFCLIIIFFLFFKILLNLDNRTICSFYFNIKNLSLTLFNKYIGIVEVSSLLLLSALIIVFHLCINKKNIRS
ncbi:NADH-quinone oxidoreductase subunit J family protein [Buchnera aphidicola]|uniref:NADH-quinone oxidoreductase subunit J family protein n=1 Tax=Buchnera aphidicola TaxID=9 RepID=UPI002092F22C|nr:NADH-quinone oxidoreductase subunit J [Buchnera aphidicola]USS94590.1 NADH-quinone oxidoreductase subunit J [Buchnera aphidicola (Periphyllus lyropictus)]